MSGINSAKSDNCLVIGNGESRKNINLNYFLTDYTIVGCNALHRDISPDYLVCCDRRMIDEAVENLKHSETKIFIRDEWYNFYRKSKKNKKIFELPNIPYPPETRQDEKRNWGSGTYAVLISAQMNFSNIYLLGFDLYSIKNSAIGIKGGGHWYNYIKETVNNLYKDSSNYAKSDSQPVDPSGWIYQLSRVFEIYSNKNFFIINEPNWELPKEWCKSNVHFRSLNDFFVDNKYSSSIITT